MRPVLIPVLLLSLLVLLSSSFWQQAEASTSYTTEETTITNSCNLNYDITSSISKWLETYLNVPDENVKAVSTLFTANSSGLASIANNGSPGGLHNNTLLEYLWTVTKASSQMVGMGFANGEVLAYTWSASLNQFQLNYCPTNGNTVYCYKVNQVTGAVYGSAFATISPFSIFQRVWYVNGVNAQGKVAFSLFTGTNTPASFALSQAVYNPTTGAVIGVVESSIAMSGASSYPTLTQQLMALDIQETSLVYVVDTATGVLLGSTVNAPISINILATQSVNSVIASSASYIKANNIVTPTSIFVPSLGYAITIDFVVKPYATWAVVSVNFDSLTLSQSVETTITSTVTTVSGSNDDVAPVNSKTTTYINKSCTMDIDYTETVADWLPGYLSTAVWAANATSIFSNYAFTDFASMAANNVNPANSTMQSYLWSLTMASGTCMLIGYPNSYFFGYIFNPASQKFDFLWAPAAGGGSTTLYTYGVNQKTGQVYPTVIQSSPNYKTTQRPWYVGGRNNTGFVAFSGTFGPVTSNAITLLPAEAAIYTSGSLTAVIVSALVTSIPSPAASNTGTLTQMLMGLPLPTDTVVYVMYSNKYLVLGASVDIPLNFNTSAVTVSNIYIANSAKYIINNKIGGSTSVYARELGWQITTKFVSYHGLSLIVVAVDSSPPGPVKYQSTITTTKFETIVPDSASSSGITTTQTQAIVGLGSTVFVLCVVTAVLVFWLVMKSGGSSSLASQERSNDVELSKTSRA